MRYALIKDNLVKNIIECDGYTIAEMMKDDLHMDYAIGVELIDNLAIGNRFDNGKFYYTNGDEIKRQLTDYERIARLEHDNTGLRDNKSNLEQTVLMLMTQVAQLKAGGVK